MKSQRLWLVPAILVTLLLSRPTARQGDAQAAPVIAPAAPNDIGQVWANNGEDKVWQSELRATGDPSAVHNSAWDGTTISLFGARNEVVAFNLVLEAPTSDATSVEVSFDTLTGPGGASITTRSASPDDDLFNYVGRNIELFYVRYLEIRGLSRMSYAPSYDERHVPERCRRPHDGRWAEEGTGWEDRPCANQFFPEIAVPLELHTPFTITAGTSQSIWGDIYIPQTAPAGVYTGTIAITEEGEIAQEIPLRLLVHSFELPDLPNSRTMLFISWSDSNRVYLDYPWPDPGTSVYTQAVQLADRHAQSAHRHKVSVVGGGEPSAVQRMDHAWTARLSGELFTPERGYNGVGVGVGNNMYSIGTYGGWQWMWDPESEQEMWTNTDTWVNWLDAQSFATPTECFLYLIDESSNYPQTERWAQWMDDNPGPGQRLMSMATVQLPTAATETPSLDVVASWAGFGITDEWQSAADAYIADPGKRFYLYNGRRPATGSFATEDDGVALRVLAWSQYKKRIDRWFFWNSTYYTNAACYGYSDPRAWTNVFHQAQTFGCFSGHHEYRGDSGWNYSNGDGVLFYPGTDTRYPEDSYGLMGPFASLRLKHWRRGIQDVDYLALAAAIDPTRTAEIVNEAVPDVLWELGVDDPDDPTWVLSDISWSIDPDAWEATRAELADIIEEKDAQGLSTRASSDMWDWQNPLPHGNYLRDVWGSGENAVFAVGYYGTIQHYDGSVWSDMDSGTSRRLHGVWGSSGSDAFAVGTGGTVLHYDGSSWITQTSGTDRQLWDVWGSAWNDVFAVGQDGTILHYGGSGWITQTSGTGVWLRDVWGSAWNDVFAVGDGGTILHYNGSDWSDMDSKTYRTLSGVWGSAWNDVFAVGESGTILHYNGSDWSDMSFGTSADLKGVWGSSGDDILAVGHDGTILHYTGSGWHSMASWTSYYLNSVWGSGESDVLAVGDGGAVLHYDGFSWVNITRGPGNSVYGVWGSGAGDVFAVGYDGTILHSGGSGWTRMTSGTGEWLKDVWGSSGSDVFAVGYDGTILHYNGSDWSGMSSGTDYPLYAVWGSAWNDVFAIGQKSTILHYNGSSWSSMDSGTSKELYDVWGSGPNDVFAVGLTGAIVHYTGSGWSSMSSGTNKSLQAVWGSAWNDVFAVGSSGMILHYNGSGWSSMDSGTDDSLYGVWGSAWDDVFAVGFGGTILHYNGSDWSAVDSGTDNYLNNVWGSGESDVFAVGSSGTILHYGPLHISKAVSPAIVAPGDTITYTIVLHNGGTGVASGVMMTDTLPSGTSFGHWIEQGSAQPSSPTDVITWGPHDIAASGSYTICFTAQTTGEVFGSHVIVNEAAFTSANAGLGFDDAAFVVTDEPARIYLPLVLRND